ncbi:MAG: DNA primase [Ruminiclostridium sp.]|uniref:DNA primase family protein n=1 Tax=Ruminococcus sp. TaxID=41978 RepID=UPI0025FA1C1F|nr:phage/plasmid primase, P4 family [Ruminococcus sp.]MBR1432567.1 DNA primase [Ruminococcus sp.]MBR1832653.1 DNA primase [Ruminiclostridium sp.]
MEEKQDKCIWFNGKEVYEVSFCKEFLAAHPMKYVDGVFHNTDGAVDIQTVRKMIADKLLAQQVQKDFAKKVNALTGALQSICYAPDFEGSANEIHLLNGILTTELEFRQGEKKICRNRLNVNYNPTAPEPERWLSFLAELLEPEDIVTLQEYMGYCLIHSTKGQAMLFITGNGGEGKSRIGVVMYSIFGEAAYFGSITDLAGDKFLKANLVGKMVLIDDDMNLEGLKDTSFLKSLATSETPITVQAKGKQGRQVKLICRAMCFSNGAPKSLYDKTDGWERRLIILSAKPVPPDRVNDPFLSEKLIAEKEGIFLWTYRGLLRLIKNDFKFTVSEKSRSNLLQMKEDNCNIIAFLKDEQLIKFGAGLECSTADLYSAYCYWCSLNSVTALKRESFNLWLKNNHRRYNIEYSNNIVNQSSGKKARGYQGIETSYRAYIS